MFSNDVWLVNHSRKYWIPWCAFFSKRTDVSLTIFYDIVYIITSNWKDWLMQTNKQRNYRSFRMWIVGIKRIFVRKKADLNDRERNWTENYSRCSYLEDNLYWSKTDLDCGKNIMSRYESAPLDWEEMHFFYNRRGSN